MRKENAMDGRENDMGLIT